ncbi:hypothetical protein SBA5_360011 [Candidatus Sulfotelmatomonas gaucii]|uniref:Uncharacterized protein n=1 Tax=Candidatus Sulfuritelmatomonas gaucii TaxID=2043161 RepID=A0A2N9LI20_9BACT|nr:hypothetical protein SBA5_360011 [Candidatus Sulfotelmatomonas gaucii]
MGTQDQASIETDFPVEIVRGDGVFAPGANQLANGKVPATSEQSKTVGGFLAANGSVTVKRKDSAEALAGVELVQ